MKKKLLTARAILLSFLLSSCASPPDVPICIPLSMGKGWCTYTISDKEFIVDNLTNGINKSGEPCTLSIENKECFNWLSTEGSTVRVPAYSWAKIKAFIIKICKQHNECAKDITSWTRKADRINVSN